MCGRCDVIQCICGVINFDAKMSLQTIAAPTAVITAYHLALCSVAIYNRTYMHNVDLLSQTDMRFIAESPLRTDRTRTCWQTVKSNVDETDHLTTSNRCLYCHCPVIQISINHFTVAAQSIFGTYKSRQSFRHGSCFMQSPFCMSEITW